MLLLLKQMVVFDVKEKNCSRQDEQMEVDFFSDTIASNGEESTDQVWISSSAKIKGNFGLKQGVWWNGFKPQGELVGKY